MQVVDGSREDDGVRGASKFVDILYQIGKTKILTDRSEIRKVFDILLGDEFEQGRFREQE
jgi:hypothetical protein